MSCWQILLLTGLGRSGQVYYYLFPNKLKILINVCFCNLEQWYHNFKHSLPIADLFYNYYCYNCYYSIIYSTVIQSLIFTITFTITKAVFARLNCFSNWRTNVHIVITPDDVSQLMGLLANEFWRKYDLKTVACDRTCLGIEKPVQTCLNLFKAVQSCLNLFNAV